MTKSDFMKLINQLERGLPVTGWRLTEVPVWPMIRFEVYATNFSPTFAAAGLGGGYRQKLTTVLRPFGAWVAATVRDVRASTPVVPPADAVLLAYAFGLPPLVDGRRYNPLLGPYVGLLKRLGQRCVVWEAAPQGRYNIPRHTPSALIQPGLTLLRLSLARRSAPPAPPPGHQEFVAALRAEGLRTRYADLRALARDALYVRVLADRFARNLRTIGPRLGIVADYSLREQAFNLACRELGVTSVELQHGVQGPLHPSYGSFEAVPPGGYATKPRVFWAWDADSAAAINRWAGRTSGAHQAIVGGDPWREMWLKGEDSVVHRTDAAIAEAMGRTGASRHMLITLDTTGDLIPEQVMEMMRRAPSSWCFWVRIHPVDVVRRLPTLERVLEAESFRFMPARWVAEQPLHAILRHVTVHLSVAWSTVVMEASAFGVPSIAFSPEARNVYPSEAAAGMLEVAESWQDALIAVDALVRRRRQQPPGTGVSSLEVMRGLLEYGRPVSAMSQETDQRVD